MFNYFSSINISEPNRSLQVEKTLQKMCVWKYVRRIEQKINLSACLLVVPATVQQYHARSATEFDFVEIKFWFFIEVLWTYAQFLDESIRRQKRAGGVLAVPHSTISLIYLICNYICVMWGIYLYICSCYYQKIVFSLQKLVRVLALQATLRIFINKTFPSIKSLGVSCRSCKTFTSSLKSFEHAWN